jgi:alkyldihydroxyacetonephosphate synthase
MRRWNGWGDQATTYSLPESAAQYLAEIVGSGSPTPDTTLDQVVAAVPNSRIPAHNLINSDPAERVHYARGQSLPDWVALRSGRIDAFPDGVARPVDEEEVRSLLAYASRTGVRIIPYGGGTSVVGHVNPRADGKPTLTLSLERLKDLLELDASSWLATFGAGVNGPALESSLKAHGFTLGHFPQSWELSTLGGWIATRSSGQQSYYYGRIEQLFAGGHIETPIGPLDLPVFPASAAGPDLRETLLGSEGRLGVITRATVRIRPLPTAEGFFAAFFRNWESGSSAVHALARSSNVLSMLRLSDALETQTTLALAGRERLVALAESALSTLRYGPERCLLIYGLSGERADVRRSRRRVGSIVRTHGGIPVGSTIGTMWRKSRFKTPYLRNTLWEMGYALDTVETAVPWSEVSACAKAIKSVIQDALNEIGERVLVFAHLSHIYRDGASIYVTFIFRRTTDPEDILRRWHKLKTAASEAIVSLGGTISHQHGIGIDHAAYLPFEKGEVGMKQLLAIQQTYDPEGLLNPGNLFGDA